MGLWTYCCPLSQPVACLLDVSGHNSWQCSHWSLDLDSCASLQSGHKSCLLPSRLPRDTWDHTNTAFPGDIWNMSSSGFRNLGQTLHLNSLIYLGLTRSSCFRNLSGISGASTCTTCCRSLCFQCHISRLESQLSCVPFCIGICKQHWQIMLVVKMG